MEDIYVVAAQPEGLRWSPDFPFTIYDSPAIAANDRALSMAAWSRAGRPCHLYTDCIAIALRTAIRGWL